MGVKFKISKIPAEIEGFKSIRRMSGVWVKNRETGPTNWDS